jgi:hypothetical protein
MCYPTFKMDNVKCRTLYMLDMQNYRIKNTDKTVCSMQELYH